MFCPNCGSECTETSYCSNCGQCLREIKVIVEKQKTRAKEEKDNRENIDTLLSEARSLIFEQNGDQFSKNDNTDSESDDENCALLRTKLRCPKCGSVNIQPKEAHARGPRWNYYKPGIAGAIGIILSTILVRRWDAKDREKYGNQYYCRSCTYTWYLKQR